MFTTITKLQARNWAMCSLISGTLLFASWAQADTTKDFVITQKTANAANDLTVAFNNVGLVPMSAIIKDNMGNAIGKFNMAKVSPAGSSTIVYTNPVDNMGNAISVFQNYTTTLTVQSKGTGATMKGFNWQKGPSSYSMGAGVNIANSVALLSPDVDLIQNPLAGTAAINFGNEGDDYLFLTNIKVFTELTATQGDSFDANGNFITSGLPSSPNFMQSSLELTPGELEFPDINLPGYMDDGSYVVVLFDVEYSPDGSLSDAVNLGQLFYSTNQPVLTPEPDAALLLATGLGMLVIAKSRRLNLRK
ncbi:MAG TPA: hypothetical protein VGU25_16845 [Acidobacteriaceae bacterium]|nr:hypothetical protein [Acidobacteriaceae bacterium]